jgi:CHAT domain-containing protein/tetratricopeptide (TPR) repeat protein
MTQNNLGNAYSNRSRGEGADRLEQAIQAYQAALQVYTRAAFPEQWATTQNNLGIAYCEYSRGERADRLEQAIQAYQAALQIYTRAAFPEQWAETQNNLGNAFRDRIRGERADNLEAAIQAYCNALQVCTRTAFPEQWAGLQNNLGAAYRDRIRGERAENRAQAERCWTKLLAHYEAAFAGSLDGLYFARDLVAAAQKLLGLYREDRRNDCAVDVLERSKAIGLRLELGRSGRTPRNLTTSEGAEYRDRADKLRLLRSERRELERRGLGQADYAAQLDRLARTQEAHEKHLRELEAQDPDFSSAPPNFAALRQAAREHDLTIIYFHCTQDEARGAEAYILHPESPASELPESDIVPLKGLSRPEVRELLFARPPDVEYDEKHLPELIAAYKMNEKFGWMAAYWLTHLAHKTAFILDARAAWHGTIGRILGELGLLLAPLVARLRELHAQRVVLLPDSMLALFPLHALPLDAAESARHFGDEFVVSYAPSVGSLLGCLQRAKEAESVSDLTLTAIANPDGSLIFADAEVEAITTRFSGRGQAAHGSAARKQWVLDHSADADYLELSTHASYQLGDPARSAMILAHPEGYTEPKYADFHHECERLMIDDVWAGRLHVKPGCVVTADACETGQVEPAAADEEHFGFPAAFLGAGASGVIASLWAVEDMSTAWLMERTYRWMLGRRGLRPAQALKRATAWLRRQPRHKVVRWLDRRIADLELKLNAAAGNAGSQEFLRICLLYTEDRKSRVANGPEHPFAHPVYWAAFAAHGA